jgi:hypothetical protein
MWQLNGQYTINMFFMISLFSALIDQIHFTVNFFKESPPPPWSRIRWSAKLPAIREEKKHDARQLDYPQLITTGEYIMHVAYIVEKAWKLSVYVIDSASEEE